MGSKAPSWADQWGATGSFRGEEDDDKLMTERASRGGGEKMAETKAAASSGFAKAKAAASVGAEKMKSGMAEVKAVASPRFDKAKAAASVGAEKMKNGTSAGIKWVKKQYQKKSSST